jgi:purine nucleoside phosphorylase
MDSQGLGTQNPLQEAVKLIHDRIPAALQRPRVAIVCGSGLNTLGETIRGRVDLLYTSIPGFTSSTGVYQVSSRAEPDLLW